MAVLRRVALAAALALLAGSPAYAQFPFLELGQGPDVRMAGQDQLQDELAAFEPRLARQLDEAVEEARALDAELDEAPEGTQEEIRALALLAQQRVRTLRSARALVDRAEELLTAALPAPRAVGLERLVDLELEAARLAAAARQESQNATQLADMVIPPPVGLEEVRRDALEGRLASARALLGRARAYEAEARARRARRVAESAQERLQITPAELRGAQLALTSEQAAEAAQRREAEEDAAAPPPKVPRGLDEAGRVRFERELGLLAQAQTEARDREQAAAGARVLAAGVLVAALRRGLGAPEADGLRWAPEQVEAGLSRVDGQRAAVEAAMSEARSARRGVEPQAPWQRLMDGRVEAYEHALAALAEERRHLSRARTTYAVVAAREAADAPRRPWPITALLIVATVLAGLLLLTRGPGALRLLLSPSGRMGLSEERSAQLEALALLMWPPGVLMAAAAVIVWPILGLELTVLEAIKAVDLPLFYVEDSAVSALSLVEFVVTIWAAVVISRWLRRFLTDRVYPRTGWDIGLTNAFNTLAHYLVLVVGLVVGLRFVGVGFSSLAILAGVLGIGIGFGLRNITENFISGLIILAERPIKIGDFIEVKDGTVEGRVESIRARSTTVVTRDNISMIIPNSEFVARPVVNWSHGDPKVRVAIPVGVAYGSDTDLVRKALLEVAGRHGKVLKKPAPEVQFRAFGGSSLDFFLLVWIEEQQHRFRIASDLHFAVDKAFRKFGVEIAFPQLDLHLKDVGPHFSAPILSEPSERPGRASGPRRPASEVEGEGDEGAEPTRPMAPAGKATED